MIDCHVHFYPPNFTLDEIQDWHSAQEGFTTHKVVVVPETLIESQQVLDLSKTMPNSYYPCAGIHPVQLPTISASSIEDIVTPIFRFVQSNANDLVAVGECGLDYSPHIISNKPMSPESIKHLQLGVFKYQIELSKQFGLPVNVHSRNAGHYAVDAMIEGQAKGLLHAFDGKCSVALKAVSHGMYLSVPPCVVRSPVMQKWVTAIPMDFLVIETDAPALSSKKGEKNTIMAYTESIQAISDLKHIPLEQVEQICTQNALKLFPKLSNM